MSSSVRPWLSLKSVICLSSSLIMILSAILAVKSLKFEPGSKAIASTPNQSNAEANCQSQTPKSFSASHWLTVSANKTIDQPFTSLSINCISGVVNLEQGPVTRKIIISPKTFPELWKNSQNLVNKKSEPFPKISDKARIAKVPILMYHDILPRKEVFFDVTPEELESHFQLIKDQGMTPISADLLLEHLQKGTALPDKPILLSFDDAYGGHYQYVYPLLKKYGYHAVFSVYVKKMEGKTRRASLTWEQLKEMSRDPLVTIASHTVSHPRDLRLLSDDQLFEEILVSKQILEQELGIPIRYFTYPEGNLDPRVKQWVMAGEYQMAFDMDNNEEIFAGESPDLLTIGRFGQSQIRKVVNQAWGGYPTAKAPEEFDFSDPIRKFEHQIDDIKLIIISGGKPSTIHADSRYQVPEIIAGTEAIAAVDGAFFSLKYLDSNVMIGPVMSQGKNFVPGNASENPRLNGRPLVLISDQWVKFIPFDANLHNTLEGVQGESSDGALITDTFVAAAWLVKNSQAQSAADFGNLFDFEVARHRAFWGIHESGQPMIGVSKNPVDSMQLGQILQKLGFREAVMLDSGASTSLAYQGESLVGYIPRPVPHVVTLLSPVAIIEP
ncbi:MAG TPA: polysaccharide deacetylase [Cyanothece sp. UBA12306]|nr:polysaccharide deacetylase [Cyanothece sp. UBA12306]